MIVVGVCEQCQWIDTVTGQSLAISLGECRKESAQTYGLVQYE